MARRSLTPSPAEAALGLVGFLVLCFAVAGIGGHAVTHWMHWYSALVRPRFTPPNWIFSAVWTILYAVMAVAAWMIWCTPRRRARSGSYRSSDSETGSARLDGLIVFFIQLALNLAWVELFFHAHRLLVAAVILLLLWSAIFFTIVLFWRVKTLAAALLVPYLAWVTFAIALNLAFLRLN